MLFVFCCMYVCFIFVFYAALIRAYQLFKNSPAGPRSKRTGAESESADPPELRRSLAHICLHHASTFFFCLVSFISLCGEVQTLLYPI